jgi:superfamily II DNA or RNA helicase
MKDVIIERVNASFIRLYIEDKGVRQDIYETFTYPETGFVKNRYTKWNGDVHLFKLKDNLLPYGCLNMLLELAKERGWSIELDKKFSEDISKVTREELKSWVDTLDLYSDGIKISPYEYQMDALYLAIRYNRMVILAATSAGKSLVVPSQMLVDQMYNDFKDYSSVNGWEVKDKCHTIMEGRPKFANKMIYISTWQSIYEEDAEYFKSFGRVISDEVHLASGKSITTIMNNCTNAYQRLGMTGTLKNEKIHPILVMSLFGIIKRVVTTKQLIDAGRATAVDIKMFQLNYAEQECQYVSTCKYPDEIEFLISHKYRNKIIATLASSLKGNTLMMFDRLEHIEAVRQILSDIKHNKSVYVITGDVKRDERADIKAIAEKEDGVIVLGTAGCVSTGLSIKRLRNLLFCHPSKSIIRVLQSVGRLLRLHTEKDYAHVYDFIDNLAYGDKINFAIKHSLERVNIYKDDQIPLSFKKIDMSPHKSMLE